MPAAAAAKLADSVASTTHPFQENRGQLPADIAYRVRTKELSGAIDKRGVLIVSPDTAGAKPVSFRLLSSRAPRDVTAKGPADHRLNFIGAKDLRATDVRSFERVAFQSVYPGIDLEYHASDAKLEFDYVVAAGADPTQIALSIEDGDVSLSDAGDLRITSGSRELRQR